LIRETSPYLRQHAHNPVDWYPWGEEALDRARREDKPIFLSVGYSACHWCHVMERECFESPRIATLMNTHFVNIKVDREERPDLDDLYMKALMALTGSGGWPMSVFLTPDLEPFFGATYLPPVRTQGRPSFPDVLVGLADAYANERQAVVEQARELTAAIVDDASSDLRAELPDEVLALSLDQLRHAFDVQWGGFGAAPKFPRAGDVRLCLRHHQRLGNSEALLMATRTLDAMANGGMYDQLGGGFHRYSVDREWRVPHFEKMLYDNALLLTAYIEAFTLTRHASYAQTAHGICRWALGEMQTPAGGFASSQDADSEGEEGRFFVWTRQELTDVLGDKLGELTASYFDVTHAGNFEDGKSVLWIPRPAREVAAALGCEKSELTEDIARAKRLLAEARTLRVRPNTDDKVLTGWNALMVSGLALAYQALEEPTYLTAAERCMAFILDALRRPDRGLYGTARAGHAHVYAGLDDYAFVIQALCDLYECTFDADHLREALVLTEWVEEHFADRKLGGYFTTGDDQEPLIARLKSTHDGALPAGVAVHVLNLGRLAALCGREDLHERAHGALHSLGAMALRAPQAFSHLLMAFDFLRGSPREVVIAGEPNDPATRAMLGAVRSSFRPERVVALAHAGADVNLLPMLRGKLPGADGPRAFVCQDHSCLPPVSTAAELREQLVRRYAR
jgi:uncharacterized protein YyaL (SSP411 family)